VVGGVSVSAELQTGTYLFAGGAGRLLVNCSLLSAAIADGWLNLQFQPVICASLRLTIGLRVILTQSGAVGKWGLLLCTSVPFMCVCRAALPRAHGDVDQRTTMLQYGYMLTVARIQLWLTMANDEPRSLSCGLHVNVMTRVWQSSHQAV
jgi:hypothetical protein